MPEEAISEAPESAVEPQDTPTPAAPEQQEGTPAAEGTESVHDYEKRYNDLVPEYTRGQQRVSELEQRDAAWSVINNSQDADPQQVELACQILGLDTQDYLEYGDPDEDPNQQPLTRAEFQQWQRQQQEEAQSTDLATELSQHIDRLAKENKLNLSDDEKEFLFFKATRDQGSISPDTTQGVFDTWAKAQKQAQDTRFNEYRDQKLNAPHVSTVGSQATDEVLPLDAPLADVGKWAAERYAMGRQQ